VADQPRQFRPKHTQHAVPEFHETTTSGNPASGS
jgi:hypothetical protein